MALLAMAVPALAQARHDLHPAFARPTQPAFSEVLRQALLTPSRIFWRGLPLPLVTTPTPDAPTLPDDEFFDLVHLAHPFVAAMGERPVDGHDDLVHDAVELLMETPGDGDLLVRGAAEHLYTPRFVAGVEPPAYLELWLRSRWRVRGPGTLGGLHLRADGQLHVAAPSPGRDGEFLRAAGGTTRTVDLRVDGERLSAGRTHDVGRLVAAAGSAGLVIERVEHVTLPVRWE